MRTLIWPGSVFPAAAALPPNSLLTSPRMIFWAPRVSPEACSFLTMSFCWSVNVTPDRVSFDRPSFGSFSALPSWVAEVFMSTPSAVHMSSAALVAWSKTSLPLPASLRTLVNVSSRFSPDWIASSSTPDFFISDSASFET